MTAPGFDLAAAHAFARGLLARPEDGRRAPVAQADAPWPVKVYADPAVRLVGADGTVRDWLLRVLVETAGVSRVLTTAGRAVARRPVASGGALYPTELYAVIGGDAVYHFDPARHELVAVGPAPDGGDEIVLAHRFWKNIHKYGDFGYRLGAVDVGVVLGRLRAVAAARGGRTRTRVAFDDDAVHARIGVDGRDEAAYAVVEITAPGARSAGHPPAAPPAVRDRSASPRLSADLRAMHAAATAPAPETAPPPALSGERIELPRTAVPEYSRDAVRRRRSSGPSFTGKAVPAETLAAVLACCLDPHLLVLCAVRAVSGVAPGWYGYDGDGLVARGADTDPARELQAALYNPSMDVASAAFVVHLAGRLDFPGARAYRVQQMRVGAAVDAVTVSCAGLGAAAHPFLGFDTAAVDRCYGLPPGAGALAQVCVGVATGAPVLTGRVW